MHRRVFYWSVIASLWAINVMCVYIIWDGTDAVATCEAR